MKIRAMMVVMALIGVSATASAQPSARLELTEASITEVQAALTAGRMSSVQLVRQYLARIAAYDHAGPELNSLIRVNPKAAAEAAVLDAERKAGKVRGPMHGIPVIIKDNYDTGDMPTSAGSLALATSQPSRDGFVVKKLRDAGAIILGKSNLHELAAGITSISSLGGQTRNPYDPTRCPGGSSGGTGAAIAASFATVGWGSDTCGSIRIPSAFNALVGLRPTQGLVSRRGIVPLSHTQDIGGPLARTVTDLAIALDVSVGYDSEDSATSVLRDAPTPKFVAALNKTALRGARIGVFLPYFRDTDAEIADTVRAAIAAMRAQGATVVDVPMAEFDTLMANTSVINLETKFDLIDYLRTVPNAPVKSLRDILDRGLYDRQLEVRFRVIDTVLAADSEQHRTALKRQAALRTRMERILDSLSLDAIAYPTVRQKPTLVGEVQNGSTCNLGAQSGLPSISVPAGFAADGLPVGIELLGKGFTDTRLVALAYAFEQSGARRIAPSTTPALVAGKAPVAAPIVVITRARGIVATTRVTLDRVHSVLYWSATVNNAGGAPLSALVLRRTGNAGRISGPISGAAASGTTSASIAIPAGASRVSARLLGPGQASGSGSFPLTYADRVAFDAGRLTVAMYTGAGVEPVEVKVAR
ncbi:amidase family protein [Gemmatimonas sp.]|uniref:amidase family protein n=1 Tax=Gemmatimonas sp. TaxID=1962908 RepID=UPI0039837B8A